MPEINQIAPLFDLPDENGESVSLEGFRGQKVLLVFYPGDNTPVCTRQLCDYRDGIEEFRDLGVTVLGVSSDSAESHRKFREKHQLPFTLLTDDTLEVAAAYDCKGFMGMKRGVFLLDEAGVIRYSHVESLALFRRTTEELTEAIQAIEAESV